MNCIQSARRAAEKIREAYANGLTDRSLPPLVNLEGGDVGAIRDGDAVVFCCRRGERETELTEMFTDPAFDQVERRLLTNLTFVTLTRYHEKLTHALAAFQPVRIADTLAECVSRAGRAQYHCAESEKFAHVTFFLNGGVNRPFPGETDDWVPSPREKGEIRPELSAPQVTDRVLAALGQYDLIVVNYANGDVIGHRPGREDKLAAARAVSAELGRLVPQALDKSYAVLVTADHGNLEAMVRPDGAPHTSHTSAPVPLIAVLPGNPAGVRVKDGCLADVAPAVLSLMGIKKPLAMTGQSAVTGFSEDTARRVLLIILDGWGIGAHDETDAIFMADTPGWDRLLQYPHGQLRASGEYVGLVPGKSGNSEAGHLNIGAGRVVLQDDRRIDRSIDDGSIRHNPALLKALDAASGDGSTLHLIGLISRTSSHGSARYLLALCEMARALPRVCVHLVTDGSDPAHSRTCEELFRLGEQLDAFGNVRLQSVTGRKYAMDRDGDYALVKKAYDAMVLLNGIPF